MNIDYPSLNRFREFVELKDFKPPTQKEYVRYVRRLADHFQCDPATRQTVRDGKNRRIPPRQRRRDDGKTRSRNRRNCGSPAKRITPR